MISKSFMGLLPPLLLSTLLCAANAASCHEGAQADARYTCERWSEADALFERDPRWRGGDGAASLDLGGGRVLWLFGDTFVAKPDSPRRAGSAFIRNSVALQDGYDPTTADFRAYWDAEGEKPNDFFQTPGNEWLWPGHGAIVDGRLLLFFMRIKKLERWPRFEVAGWTARVIDNPEDEPTAWRMHTPKLPACSLGSMNLAASVMLEEQYLHAFGTQLLVDGHPGILLRWPLKAISNGNLSQPDLWDSKAKEWINWGEPAEKLPLSSLPNAQEEYTVHHSQRFQQYLQVQTKGFPVGEIAFRSSLAREGPWSDLQTVHEAEERNLGDKVFIYSGKAHPEQAGKALALTYCTNTEDFAQLFQEERLYYPRFLRLTVIQPSVTGGDAETPSREKTP